MSPMGEELPARLPSCAPSLAQQQTYDAIVVGAGPVGCALAYGLGMSGRKILVVERDLSYQDRIVGELLQPGGCASLAKLGMLDCLDDIDARVCEGYVVFCGQSVLDIPYPQLTDASKRLAFNEPGTSGVQQPESSRYTGRSFHHGQFVASLRRKAASCSNVTFVEATVNELLTGAIDSKVVLGVTVTPSLHAIHTDGSCSDGSKASLNFIAPLTMVVDGYASKFRRQVLPSTATPVVRSHFVALLLKDAPLPRSGRGHVFIRDVDMASAKTKANQSGPVLVYQLSKHDTRMLVDVPGSKLPSMANGDLKVCAVMCFALAMFARLNRKQAHLKRHVTPILSPDLVPCFKAALNNNRLRSMPNSFLPAYPQHRAEQLTNVLLVGDALNMRHPLTGGGMSVGFGDAVILTELLGGAVAVGESSEPIDFTHDKEQLAEAIERWYWMRKPHSSAINVLAQALSTLFSGDDENLSILRVGAIKYMQRGGRNSEEPVGILGALIPSLSLLFYHFFAVAFFSLYLLFVTPPNGSKESPGPLQWPYLFFKSFSVLWTACVVLLPFLWTEMRY